MVNENDFQALELYTAWATTKWNNKGFSNLRRETYIDNNDRNIYAEELCNVSMGLIGEAGEFVEEIKKVLFHGHNVDQQKISKELGDMFFYWGIACYLCGLNPGEVIIENMRKLNTRYPNGFDPLLSQNRKYDDNDV